MLPLVFEVVLDIFMSTKDLDEKGNYLVTLESVGTRFSVRNNKIEVQNIHNIVSPTTEDFEKT